MALNGEKDKGIWFLPYMVEFGLHHRFMPFKSYLSISMYCPLWGYSLSSDALTVVFYPRVVKSMLSISGLGAIFSMRFTPWLASRLVNLLVLPSEHSRYKEFSEKVLKQFSLQRKSSMNRLGHSGVG